ncbi:MAG: ABC transporter permease [Acidimicrobiia bacterium]
MILEEPVRLSRRDLRRLSLVLVPVGGLSLFALWSSRPSADAVHTVIALPGFWASYRFSVAIAFVATATTVAAGVLVGFLVARRQRRLTTLWTGVLSYNLGVAHLVWAVALLALLSPSGWIARIVASLGLIDRPDQFPLLVNDLRGFGIIVHLVTKEVPFVVLVTLPLTGERLRREFAQAAALGARPRSQLLHVYVPRIAPALVPATVVVFAFALGGYEPAAVLGVQNPRTLAVVAVEWFRDPAVSRRSEAFALSSIMIVTTLSFALVWVGATRRWWRRAGR